MKKPLGFIINKLSSLQNSQQIENQDKESIKEVQSSVISLLNIMNNSLNLYKMETHQYALVPEAVDIIKVTIRVKDDLSHFYSNEIKAKNIQIKLKIMTNQRAIIKGEELLCYSILSNLLKNAIEASETNELIKISITAQDQVTINIHNQAEIPPQIQNCFFNKYACQGKERQEKKQSTGLGTYSAKLMTEIQHGQIEFSSSATEGTGLSVKLPKWDTA
jgi:signal transduction histidine kinase